MPTTIAVEDLRVGMYVQLDGGWLSHPFPLSSFRIAGAEQISTLRGLGLARVRWVPEKSELAVDQAADAELAIGNVLASPMPAADAGDCQADASLPLTPAQRAQVSLAAWAAAQREAARLCERQFGEASLAWRSVLNDLAARPQEAGRSTHALSQAMLDKMLAAEDVGIRLVSGGSDRAAAHALNVAVISLLIGRTLGLNPEELADLGVGALMHDVGKLDVVERYRHAEDGFTPGELAAYRDHVVKGIAQAQRMDLSPGALAVLAHHHEHADGTGFPARIRGERIGIGARIVAIVDHYDKLCNPSSRALALTPHQAVAMLFAQGRQRFDSTVLNTFIRMMGVYPAGSLVQLTDDRYAMVVGVNSSRPLKPRVLVHDPAHATQTIQTAQTSQPGPVLAAGSITAEDGNTQLLDLEQLPNLGIRRSLPASKIPTLALQALDPRPRVAYYFEPISRNTQAAHDRALVS